MPLELCVNLAEASSKDLEVIVELCVGLVRLMRRIKGDLCRRLLPCKSSLSFLSSLIPPIWLPPVSNNLVRVFHVNYGRLVGARVQLK